MTDIEKTGPADKPPVPPTPAAGPEAIIARNESGGQLLGTLLGPKFEDSPKISALALEAIVGAIYGTLYDRVRSEGPESLLDLPPLLIYVALTPILGAEAACAVANDHGSSNG